MCFHNAMSKNAVSLQNRYKAKLKSPQTFKPIYHGSAFNFIKWPVITNTQPAQIQEFTWGLIPSWVKAKEQANGIWLKTINAKCETAFEKPSFKKSIASQRCLVPSTGFFEWQTVKNVKIPYFITLRNPDIFSMAGIWDEWTDEETGEIFNTFSILTVSANPLLAKIHNVKKRMPVILSPDKETSWLSNYLTKEDVISLCVPFDETLMKAHTVSRLLTSRVDNPNTPEVQKEYFYPALAEQMKLL